MHTHIRRFTARASLWLGIGLLLSAFQDGLSVVWHHSMFAPCPVSPNCVSSDARDARQRSGILRRPRLPRMTFGPGSVPLILSFSRTKIVVDEKNYLHAECRSASGICRRPGDPIAPGKKSDRGAFGFEERLLRFWSEPSPRREVAHSSAKPRLSSERPRSPPAAGSYTRRSARCECSGSSKPASTSLRNRAMKISTVRVSYHARAARCVRTVPSAKKHARVPASGLENVELRGESAIAWPRAGDATMEHIHLQVAHLSTDPPRCGVAARRPSASIRAMSSLIEKGFAK